MLQPEELDVVNVILKTIALIVRKLDLSVFQTFAQVPKLDMLHTYRDYSKHNFVLLCNLMTSNW